MNENSLKLRSHVMELFILTYKTYQTDARQKKMASIVSVANITSAPSYTCTEKNQYYDNIRVHNASKNV